MTFLILLLPFLGKTNAFPLPHCMQDILPFSKAQNFSQLALLAMQHYRRAFQNTVIAGRSNSPQSGCHPVGRDASSSPLRAAGRVAQGTQACETQTRLPPNARLACI